MQMQEQAAWVREGRCALGIELGSTRIKAVLIGPDHAPAGRGRARLGKPPGGRGTGPISLDDVWAGVQDAYAELAPQLAGNLRRCPSRRLERRGRLGHDARLPAL